MTRFSSQQIPYAQTKAFSSIVTDYLAGAPGLKPFYAHQPGLDGIKDAIAFRKKFSTNRSVLVNQLKVQYAGIPAPEKVLANIELLLQENTFTITTAHQPNIFTGHLYFIYKILHAIKLADELTAQITGCNFVPVYYMGSEDADLEELGVVNIDGKKYLWQTEQTGAVGRMKIDKAFITLMDAIEGRLLVEPFGKEILSLVRSVYSLNKTIEQATFELINELFASYGLVVLLPDNAVLKNEFAPIIRKELLEQFSAAAVTESMSGFPVEYKVQAAGRETNLFYLRDNIRERIEKVNGQWLIVNTNIKFDEQSILRELQINPERFSPNVILRPVFQELILPNIAFIGGGGELAYWLELKKVFEAVAMPYPVLILRNSFMLVNKKISQKMEALKISVTDFFKPTHEVMNQLVKQLSDTQLQLTEEKKNLGDIYEKIKRVAAIADHTLEQHTDALLVKALKKIEQLEKKMLLAEKKKFEAQQRQVEFIKTQLFPSGSLQERTDNMMSCYAAYGKAFIQNIYEHSQGLHQQFCIMEEKS